MQKKPANVPEGAFWDESDREWVLAERNDDDELHGLVKYYRPDGTLCCETDFVDGTPHGGFKRYHENGEVSRTGTFVEGTLRGTNVHVRSTEETTENFPDGLESDIWRCEMDYVDGDIVEGRLYDREGRRVMEDGRPFPEVPPGVPASAHFRKPDDEDAYFWIAGVTRDDDGSAVRMGTWRYWTEAGVLVREEPYEEGELHGTVRVYDEDTGELVAEHRYEDGERQFDRPSSVPEEAVFDSDAEEWILDPSDANGELDGDRCGWTADGALRWRETLRKGLIQQMCEYLADGSLAQESTFIDGGVPRRKWFRRTEKEELESFPSVLDEHPDATEVEYLFDEHGFMSGYRISAGGVELERTELHRNAANTTEQMRFSSTDEASAAWIAQGDRYTAGLNAWLAELYETGEPSEEEPTFGRDDLERAVIESVATLNARGEGRLAREKFPLYYDGIGKAFWDKYGLVIDRVLDTGSEVYARVNPPGVPRHVVRISGGRIETVEGVLAFGSSHDKRLLAFAYDDRIEVKSGRETITLSYPTRYQHPRADALVTASLGTGRAMDIREVRVLPGGTEVLLISAQGIHLVGKQRAQRLYPLDASLDAYVDAFEEETCGEEGVHALDLAIAFPNADVSPAGDRITCGGMLRRGIMAGLAIYRRDEGGAWKVEATSQADAFFPIQAVFHRTRPHIALAACLYASLRNALVNTTFRLDLNDIEPGDIDEFSGGLAQERGVVHAIASFGDGFLLGFDNGYVRWMGVEENLQQLGYVFVGGSIRHIDVGPDQRSFVVVSDAGLVSAFTLADRASRNLVTTMSVVDRERTAFFRTYPPLAW